MKQEDLAQAVRHACNTTAWRIEPEDIMQDTVVALLDMGQDLATADRALVFAIAKRVAIDSARKLRSIPVAFQMTLEASQGAAIMRNNPSDDAQPEQALDTKELDMALGSYAGSLMAKLGVKERTVARAWYLDGQDGPAIADALGWKPALVRKWLMKTRQTLGTQEGDMAIIRQHFNPGARAAEGDPEASEQLRNILGQYSLT